MLKHFVNEIQYLSLLKHQNIVRVLESATNRPLPLLINPDFPLLGKALDLDQFKTCSYLAMEFADKGNLFDYVCHKPISENATCYYIR